MKQIVLSNDKRNVLLLWICFLGLVFSLKLYGLGIILVALYAFKEKLSCKHSFWFYRNRPALLLIAFYLIFIFGLLYSTNVRIGLFSLEKMLSVAILPILLASIPPLKNKTITKALASLPLIVSLACMIIWLKAFAGYQQQAEQITLDTMLHFVSTHQGPLLSDAGFTSFHHPYLGLMVTTSVLIIFCYFKQLPYKYFYLPISLFLLLFLIQLEAKMSLISLILVLLVYIIIYLKDKSPKGLIIFLASAAFLLGAFVFLKAAPLKAAVQKVVYADGGSRVRNWESATKAIQEAPLFGYGTGDPVSALQAYRHKGSWEYQEKYNVHNQYLDIILRFGLVGLFYWLFLLGYIFWKGYATKQYFFSLFVLLFALCSFTEVLLARFHGIALFAIMLSIFANTVGTPSKNDHPKVTKEA